MLLVEVALATNGVIKWAVPRASAITRIAISMLCANAAGHVLLQLRWVAPISRGAFFIVNLATVVTLSALALLDSALEPDPIVMNLQSDLDQMMAPGLSTSRQPEIGAPSFVRELNSKVIDDKRASQGAQILRAVGGKESPHAQVVDSDPQDVKEILATVKDREVFHLIWNKFDHSRYDELFQFLNRHNNSILYLSDLGALLEDQGFKAIFTDIQSRLPHISLVGCVKSDKKAKQGFKQVHLHPLKQDACLEVVQKWASNYIFEEKALEIAVEAAFLLRGGKGTELRLIKDLLERANQINREQPISKAAVWDVFKEFHLAEELALKEEKLFSRQSAPMPLFLFAFLLLFCLFFF